MDIRFDQKTVLITGASRGIGRATAELFAASGATVVIHYHQDREAAEKVLGALPGNGHSVIRADLGDPHQVQSLAEQALSGTGRIDILVNNAGVFEELDMTGISEEEFLRYWERTIRVDLTGPAVLSNLVARKMIAQGGGKIVNVSSRGAFRGEPVSWAYGAAKAGLNALGQSMARALASKKVYIFTIAPGYVVTDLTLPFFEAPGGTERLAQSPMNRAAQPEEIARAILLLASDGLEYMTGCILDMNGASYLRT